MKRVTNLGILSVLFKIALIGGIFFACKNDKSKQSAPEPAVNSGNVTTCSDFVKVDKCPPEDCKWTDNKCVTKVSGGGTPDTQCDVQQIASCRAPKCSWTGASCVNLSQPPQCSLYTDVQFCPSPGCSVVNQKCTAATSNDCSAGNGNQQGCNALVNQGCQWNNSTQLCTSTTATIVNCALNSNQGQCQTQIACSWNGMSCGPASTGNNDICKNYNVPATCPASQGCIWSASGCVFGTSQSNICSTLAGNAVTCDRTEGCQWYLNTCTPSICKKLSATSCYFSPNCTYLVGSGCYPR